MKEYTHLAIDALNIAYRLGSGTSPKNLIKLSNKVIIKDLVKEFIEIVSYWENKFLVEGGEVFLLFDNPTSRDKLKELFQPLPTSMSRKEKYSEYKSNRVAATKEFYNSLDLVKWYYMMSPSRYATIRITHLEADDLVKPFIEATEGKRLLISNDSDWCRFIGEGVDYLPSLYEDSKTVLDFASQRGFYPTEDKIVLEKVILGDAADHVASAVPELSKEEKKYLITSFDSVSHMMETIPDGKIKSYLINQERHIKAAFQMVSIIPITVGHFNACLVRGRDSKSHISVINKMLGIEEANQPSSFQFSFVPHPRVDPKEI